MVHPDNSKRQKGKPRGRPFARGHKRGKLENEILDSSRHDGSLESENVIDIEKNENKLNLLDSLEFKNGENKISINLIKRSNNSYRIQIFLNEKNEIRPTTYNGSSMAFAYWDLLKGTLKNA